MSTASGLDRNLDRIGQAKERYMNIIFSHIDLNVEYTDEKYDIITCFEVLEHVGNIENALENLYNMLAEKGQMLITVPIEVGVIGLAKFLLKTLVWQYKLKEINKLNDKYFYIKYFCSLLINESVSKYRNESNGYGTHFGFDYRVVGSWFNEKGIRYSMSKKGTTVFFTVFKA